MRFTDAYFGYIEKLGGDGWLRVKFDNGAGLIWPLPEYLKVSVIKPGEREEFVILEGRFTCTSLFTLVFIRRTGGMDYWLVFLSFYFVRNISNWGVELARSNQLI